MLRRTVKTSKTKAPAFRFDTFDLRDRGSVFCAYLDKNRPYKHRIWTITLEPGRLEVDEIGENRE